MLEKITEIFDSLRERFCTELTEDWFSTIHFVFSDDGNWTFDVNNGQLEIREGLVGEPLSIVKTDKKTFDRVFSGEIPLEMAIMADKFTVDNIVEVFKLQTVFKKRKL